MADIIKKYKKHKKYSNLIIVLAGLILAISINMFVIDSSAINKQIKTSLLESENQNDISDIYMQVSENNENIDIVTSKKISDITNMNITFLYNPNNINIKDIVCSVNSTTNINSDQTGISSIIIDFPENTNFTKNEKICSLEVIKNTESTEQLIIDNISFLDKNGALYEPTTTALSF